ncbi:MAG: hypothetical protein IJM59_11240 [Proteobacteria bacterium]|nr:hypothetical protein [Pseudomonadota bacterium]
MRNLLLIGTLFLFILSLNSCDKEDAYAIKCIGDNCQPKPVYPVCLDEQYLIVSDDPNTSPQFCPNGCIDDHCISECTDGKRQCVSDSSIQICLDGKWVISDCLDQCTDGACIINSVLCSDGALRCSDSDVEICINGRWEHKETCPYGCQDAHCAGCHEGERRCTNSDVEICQGGIWKRQETCPDGCLNGSCITGCSGPDYCQDSTTSMQCINDAWVAITCENGCKNGKCQPEVEEQLDHRLTNKLCSEKDEEGIEIDIFVCNDDYKTNELGGVCVDAGPHAFFCLPKCNPNASQKYYCEGDWAAMQGDCMQISDGSYAIIANHIDYCSGGCTPQNGCSTIKESFDIYPPYCDNYENYCEGTIVHECMGQMETYDCREYGSDICVQFWSNIYCASPCDVEGDVYYECSHGYNMMYSTAITCVPDDNGVLSWQYNHGVTNECPNGCNEDTGLCY